MNSLITAVAASFGLRGSGIVDPLEYDFHEFISREGRSYGTFAEYKFRLELFRKKDAEINAIKKKFTTFQVGHNMFSDRTHDEYKQLLGYKQTKPLLDKKVEIDILDITNLADEVNWVTAGAVNPVKDQGQCGSCWSFSTTGAMEGAHFVKYGELVVLSEQNLVDCSSLNLGCQGGVMDRAFGYAESHPLVTESDYPYTAKSGPCKYDKTKGVFHFTTYKAVAHNSQDQLKAALNKQPVSVAIEADQTVFQHYTTGVLTGSACGTSLDHGVLAVGYGVEKEIEYFLVKNSWTAAWGDKGYIKLGVEAGAGVCGIQSSPSYPTID